MSEETKPATEHAQQMPMLPVKTYLCLWCGRELQGEPTANEDGELVGFVFKHDNVPHPDTATYDEENNPQ